ncbi:hypothetical protein J1N35_008150 [Gossypium stocksii]|uniref:UBC core domain-containing protein n=1 Tax=Gossypium stocksii TaxID=47602 RepID=A0A9D3W8A3_9ROSI|nr:hypothetical protein J1N35_008150 [Gossypium stocksii]
MIFGSFLASARSFCSLLRILPSCCLLSSSNLDIELSSVGTASSGCGFYPDGRVCISILHPPGDDPNGYELASERWMPVHTVGSIVLSIISMLSSPNDESPANVEAAVSDCRLEKRVLLQ